MTGDPWIDLGVAVATLIGGLLATGAFAELMK